jgi:hypothetical protein
MAGKRMKSPEDILAERGATILTAAPEPAAASLDNLKCFTSHEFTAMRLKPREYLIEPILRNGGLAMLSAFRGVGKTQVAMGLAHAVSTGGAFLRWRAPRPRQVLYVDGEMPGADLQERLRMLGPVNTGNFRLLPMDEQDVGVSLNLNNRDSQRAVERLLGAAELLVLDNRSTLVVGGRENDAESWDPMQGWLLQLRRRGVSVLLVEHEGRSGNPRGTSKREDVLDTLIHLKHPDDYRAEDGARFEVHLTKARGIFGDAAKAFEAKLEVREGVGIWSVRDLTDVELERVKELTGEGMSVREIAEATGIAKSKVNRLQQRIKEVVA